jgi:hypothetical protein
MYRPSRRTVAHPSWRRGESCASRPRLSPRRKGWPVSLADRFERVASPV